MKTLTILVFSILLSTVAMAQKEALIVGISNYAGDDNDLPAIELDTQNMKALFKKWGFHVTTIFDADSMNFDAYMEQYHALGKNDTFALYYSGHGSQTKDTSGDEVEDGLDETIVLSDGHVNKHFVDDDIYTHLNKIKAKKLVIFDSCHSGTAFKTYGNEVKAKKLSSSSVSGTIKPKSFRHQKESSINSKGEYVIFSAAQDTEESWATTYGGMFTNAFLHQFNNGAEFEKMANVRKKIEDEIYNYCKKEDMKVHKPNLSASTNKLKYMTMNAFLKSEKSDVTPVSSKKRLSIMGKKTFNEGELLSFKINTHGTKGYLTIFSIENGEPFIMTQTSKTVSGILNFQEDFSISPPIECYKACGTNCTQERSTVYIILSAKPLTKKIMQTKGLKIDKGNETDMRAFRQRTSEAYEPLMTEVEFTIIN